MARFLCVLIGMLVCGQAWSQPANGRPKIAVALQGGGARGLAHIGVLHWFEDHHIPVDYVAGTSMGGLVGGLYATAHNPEEIEKIIEEIDWRTVLSGAIPYPQLAFRRKEDLRALPNAVVFGLKNGVQTPGGLNSGQGVRFIIDRYVLPYSDGRSFDLLPVPFRCVATDLVSGKSIVLRDGSLADALRATMSIPGMFSPTRQDGMILADGALLNNLPTDVAKQMGADIVVGVHLTTGPVAPENLSSLFQVARGSIDLMINANEVRGMEQADILITVDLAGYSTLDFSRAEEIIAQGYAAAEARSAVLRRLSLNDEDWKQYLAQRESRVVKSTPVPTFVAVKGTSPKLAKDIKQQMSPFVDKPIDSAQMEDKLSQQVGLGRFNSLSYSLINQGGEPGLLISAEEKDYSPPWFKPGFTIDGSEPSNVQFTLGAQLVFLDVGGYRSEWRTDFAVGSTYLIGTEYYHPFSATSHWFVAPAVQASRSPLNLYLENTLLAEYRFNSVVAGLDFGYAFDRFSELRFGYQTGYLQATRWVGDPLLPTVSGRTGVSRASYIMDHLDNPVVPRRGTSLVINGGWNDAYPGSRIAFPSAEMTFEAFHPVSERGSVYFVAAGGTVFGRHPGGLPLFFLGGPGRLASYGSNQFLTDQYWYLRGGYLHQVGEMPKFLGSGIFLDGHYEVARPYAISNPITLPNNAVVGLVMETVVGPVLVGASGGPDYHFKWFFQVGRVF